MKKSNTSKLFSKIIATTLTLCLSCTGFSTPTAQGRSDEASGMSTIQDGTVTDAQAMQIVGDAFEKFKTHDSIAYILEEPDDWSYFAYDMANGIAAFQVGVPSYYYSYRDTGVEDDNDWIDINNRLLYELEYYSDDPSYTFYPMTKSMCDEYVDYYFSDLVTAKEDAFPIAETYQYVGNMWEYGADKEKHLCYIFEVPESDASIYLRDEYYLPTCVYIGVDDGEVYRIDEKRYFVSSMETSIVEYRTHFTYPESLSVPKRIVKKATLSEDYVIKKNGIKYVAGDSTLTKGGLITHEFTYKCKKSQKRNLKFPSTLTVLGKKYKVVGISWGSFYYEDDIKSVKLGKNMVSIEGSAFYKCSNLSKLNLSSGKLKSIGYESFARCKSLTSVDIPDTVTKIGKKAFARCSKLQTVKIGKRIKTIGKDAFLECNSLKKLVIKNKSMADYARTAAGRKHLGIGKDVEVVQG